MKTELEKELEAQTGMSRWWEETDLGYTYLIRCPCGMASEAISEPEAGASLESAQLRALSRFRLLYPSCPHLEPYDDLLSAWHLIFVEGQCHERC